MENKVDNETMELMVSIMRSWVKKLIEGDMMLVMWLISLWTSGHGSFETEIPYEDDDDGEGQKGGPTGYLAWKIMVESNYRDAIKLVIDLRESGLKPEIYSCLIAMTAIVKELNEFAKALHKLKGFARSGLVAELDMENVKFIEKYQSDLLADGLRLSNWAIQEGSSSLNGLIHERLLSMYICAGRGLEAERQLKILRHCFSYLFFPKGG
ncbi:hypothetical protein DITRI_Ditri05aG0008500 [Diplodiscus trichospermus]